MRRKVSLLALLAALIGIVSLRSPQPEQPAPPVTTRSQPAAPKVVDFSEWVTAWRAGNAEVAQGIAAAQARRERMIELMQENPRQAFAESISLADWRALPPEIQPLVERPFSERVTLSIRPICKPLDPSIPPLHPQRVLMGEEWFDAFVFGRRTDSRSKEELPVRGFELGGKVVLAEEAVERISPADLLAVEAAFPTETEGRSWLTGEPIGAEGRRVLIGGRIYDLGSDSEEQKVSEFIARVEGSKHPRAMAIALAAGAGTIKFDLDAAEKAIDVANSTWTETIKRTIALRISYASSPTSYSYASEAELRSLMNNVSNAVKVMSYGKTALQVTVVSVTLPQSHQYYQDNGPDAISRDTRTRLQAMGMNRDNYDFATHAHPGHNFSYAGLGQIGAGDCWLNGNQGLEVTTHEIGHNYGLGHAHYVTLSTGFGTLGRNNADGSVAEREEYGDIYDIMGGSSLPSGQYGAYGKAALNWIEPREVINVFTNGIYRVHRFDHQSARTNAANRLALKVVAPGGDEFWVSHRKLFASNANMSRGANIVKVDGSADQSLIDTTPLSKPAQGYGTDRDDAGLAIGRSFIDPLGTVEIKTIAAGGTAPQEFIDVQVSFLTGGAYDLFTDVNRTNRGLTASFVNRSLRTVNQTDWRSGQVISGKRVDRVLSFRSNGWGVRSAVGITGGTDANWDNFSAQWDGVIVVNRPTRLATVSDDGSRFWIDTNNSGTFTTTELVNNGWGSGHGAIRGALSPVIRPGAYLIRIQYEEGNGDNSFALVGAELPFELFTTEAATTPGLTGSYIARSLRASPAQTDWRAVQTVAGTRVDEYPAFTKDGWGALSSAGLTAANGTDADWNNFSVQWDGWLSNSVPVRFATASDDYSRMWIDVNGDGAFATAGVEYINNGWGGANGQGLTVGAVSGIIQPGRRRIRIQYEEGAVGNAFVLLGAPPVVADAPISLGLTTFSGSDNRTLSRRGSGDFTIQFWMQSTQVMGGEVEWTDGAGLVDASVPGNGRDFGTGLGNGKVLFGVGGSNPATIRSPFVADGQWHYICARREITNGWLTLFVDGVPVATGIGGVELLDEALSMRAGSYMDNGGFYVGLLDAVRIWEEARTDQEIFADYHLSRAGHGFAAGSPPIVQIGRFMPGTIQVFWDAQSNFRALQSASTPGGPWTTLGTDQNSTNITIGPAIQRYFRVMRP